MSVVASAKHVYRRAEDRIGRLIYQRGDFVDTEERVPLAEFGLKAPGRHQYQASGWTFLPRGLRRSEVGPDDVFVEFGCGKGRVIHQAASRYPFKRVIGVELADPLAEIARRNVAQNRAGLRCEDVEIVTADVLEWEIPDDMTIAYMFNPFTGEIFERTLARIVESVDRAPRRVRLIYADPLCEDLVERNGRFRLLRRDKGIRRNYRPTTVTVWEVTR